MKLIAHACGPTEYPSNSVPSALLALKNGACLAEMDLQFTSDGRLAVFHDADLSKKFGRPEKCGEVSADEFRALRRRENPEIPGYLLEDFFRAGVAPILLHHGQAVMEATMDLVEEYGYRDKVVFGVTRVETVLGIRARFPEARVLGFIPSPDHIEAFAEAGASYLRLWDRWLTPENVARVKKSGAELWIMTGGPSTPFKTGLPDAERLLSYLDWEPDGLLVNDIPFTRSVFAL